MRQDLENRLIDFAGGIIKLSEHLKDDKSSKHLAEQMVRSGTSSALNYGEAQNAESKKDYIHKTSIVQKELRETHINLQIIYKAKLYNDEKEIKMLLQENNELLAIFTSSILTAKRNLAKENAS
jgi:four helix bundle protein